MTGSRDSEVRILNIFFLPGQYFLLSKDKHNKRVVLSGFRVPRFMSEWTQTHVLLDEGLFFSYTRESLF